MSEKTTKLRKKDILTTTARQIVFDAVLEGLNLKQAAKKAKLGHNYVKNWVTNSDFYPLVEQERAKLAQKTAIRCGITLEKQIRKHAKLFREGVKRGQISAANAAVIEQSKLCGLYQQQEDDAATLKLPVIRTAEAQIAYLEERKAFFVQQKDIPLGTAE